VVRSTETSDLSRGQSRRLKLRVSSPRGQPKGSELHSVESRPLRLRVIYHVAQQHIILLRSKRQKSLSHSPSANISHRPKADISCAKHISHLPKANISFSIILPPSLLPKKNDENHLFSSFFLFTHTTPYIASPIINTILPSVIIVSLVLPVRLIPTINTISPTIHSMHPAIVSFFILFSSGSYVLLSLRSISYSLALRKPPVQVFSLSMSKCLLLFI